MKQLWQQGSSQGLGSGNSPSSRFPKAKKSKKAIDSEEKDQRARKKNRYIKKDYECTVPSPFEQSKQASGPASQEEHAETSSWWRKRLMFLLNEKRIGDAKALRGEFMLK